MLCSHEIRKKTKTFDAMCKFKIDQDAGEESEQSDDDASVLDQYEADRDIADDEGDFCDNDAEKVMTEEGAQRNAEEKSIVERV